MVTFDLQIKEIVVFDLSNKILIFDVLKVFEMLDLWMKVVILYFIFFFL